jgi:hypothetical protein
MNFRTDVFEHDHHAITPDESPEIAFVSDFKAEFRAVEIKTRLQVVNNEERRDAVEQRLAARGISRFFSPRHVTA